MNNRVRCTVALLISLVNKLTSTGRRSRLAFLAASAIVLFASVSGVPQASGATCANPVACENLLPGTPQSVWDIGSGEGTTIQGFAAPFSVNIGQTIQFKIESPASSYKVDIYRMGYYGGDGARLEASVTPNIAVSKSQPACSNNNATTGLTDCSNWGVSASWAVPATAVSGVYFAHIYRTDGSTDENQIPFVVRNDASHSDIMFKTSDETWQAYNDWGGNSLYSGTAKQTANSPLDAGRAVAVSYDRPFSTRFDTPYGQDYFFYAEYPMIQFLEENGYDVSYTDGASVAADTGGVILSQHKAFMSTGHDEYWSGPEVTNVTDARNNGVNVAFFSGNEIFWKTRWSTDNAGTPYRTLITYKESLDSAKTDPAGPATWTGQWADPRFSPPGDGGRPQNALSGQIWTVNEGTYAIQVPSQYAKLRLWRNTSVANLQAGQTATMPAETLGYEWDQDVDNGFQPAGLIDMSSTTQTPPQVVYDYQEDIAPITTTHHLTLYRAPSGALVFDAGTVQWAWGLNSNHDGDSNNPPSPAMQQATANILADMHAQPTTLMSGLTPATASTDTTPPTSKITSPASGTSFNDGVSVTVSGTATDGGGGVVAGVEISTDGGNTWHPVTTMSAANTSATWSYNWIAHGSPTATVETRATDDSGNIETPSDAISVNIGCPCSIWGPNVTPAAADSGDGSSIEVGVKFTSDVAGTINGIRFYKASTNTGTHIGDLWTGSGQLLSTATFTNETASGWQQVNFSQPVPISANTTYVASYFAPKGHYSQSEQYFYPPLTGGVSLNAPPLHAPQSTTTSPNGVYMYSGSSTFPSETYNGENYWVDVSFTPTGPPTAPGAPTNVAATAGNGSATVTWAAPSSGGAPTSYTVTPHIGTTAQTPVTVTGTPAPTSATVNGLANGTTYTFTVTATNSVGTGPASTASNAVTPSAPTVPGTPTNVSATAGNASATVTWTVPSNGGSTITSYTVTPYVGSTPQQPTTVSGTVTSANVTGLTNGTSYTFTVAATNAVGTGAASAASSAVTPSVQIVSPAFVQQVAAHTGAVSSLSVTPSSALTAGNRLVVVVGAWASSGPTAKTVTDSAGDTFTELLHFKASDGTEMSAWTAPITAGGGTKPTIKVTPSAKADLGVDALEYSGLSAAAGTAAVDQMVDTSGTTGSSGATVQSGATAATTAANELAIGLYVDSGFGDTLTPGAGFTQHGNVSPDGDMEFLVEDAPVGLGATPSAPVGTGSQTTWLMATVVFKA